MNLTQHFTKEDFEKSNTARRLGIDNTIPHILMNDAALTAEFMEGTRAYLSKKANKDIPVVVSSAYRCPALNKAIGSVDTSDHPKMGAVDFIAPEFGTPYEICKALEPALDELGIAQIIFEFDSWVHVSRLPQSKVLNRILTVNKKGTTIGIIRNNT
jgi:hypothetical protein